MKKIIKNVVLGLVAVSALVTTVSADSFTQRVQVKSSEPIYADVRISAQYKWERSCEDVWVEDTRNNSNNQYGVTHEETIGTLLGGAIGNKLGSGGHSDRKAFGTILGAVIGNKIGSEYKSENESTGHYESRCSKVRVRTSEARTETKLVGYKITADFGGRTISKKVRNKQDYIQVRISY
jgi:uncharacterized protein YcfJ